MTTVEIISILDRIIGAHHTGTSKKGKRTRVKYDGRASIVFSVEDDMVRFHSDVNEYLLQDMPLPHLVTHCATHTIISKEVA